jgi:phosphonate transport system substrate-binding protein
MPSRWQCCATAHPEGGARRGVLRTAVRCALAALLGSPGAVLAQGVRAEPAPPFRFGVLPVGGAVESRTHWTPLLDELGRAIGRPVSMLSLTSYESLDRAIQRKEVDLALLPGKLALDAVTQRRMNVLAQVSRHEGAPEHRAVLLARKTGPALADVLARPERWRLARGDTRSVSGFMVPQLELFLPRGIAMETRFESEIVDTQQGTALAVANGDADVATNNTTDFGRFKQQFPAEADRLQIIWRSEPTPPALFVVRREHPVALQKTLQAFLEDYGRAKGPRGYAEREVLKSLHAALGYEAADNAALLPAAALDYRLAKQQALSARWVSEAARRARLASIENRYAEQAAMLRGGF